MQCRAMQRRAMQRRCNAMQRRAMQRRAMHRNAHQMNASATAERTRAGQHPPPRDAGRASLRARAGLAASTPPPPPLHALRLLALRLAARVRGELLRLLDRLERVLVLGEVHRDAAEEVRVPAEQQPAGRKGGQFSSGKPPPEHGSSLQFSHPLAWQFTSLKPPPSMAVQFS